MSTASPHPSPPPGYRLRAASPGDAGAVAALRRAAEVALHGASDVTIDGMLAEWALPGLSLASDTWLLETGDGGEVVGYGLCWVEEPGPEIVAEQVVHPARRGEGLSEFLLDLGEARAAEVARAAEPDGGCLGVWAHESDGARIALYRRHGYEQTGAFLRLERDLDGSFEPPAWPAGIRVAPFRRGLDEAAVHAAYEAGFFDDSGPPAADFDAWVQSRFGHADPDYGLWLIAWDGQEVVGGIESTETPAGAYMGDLFVRPEWRGRGLGRALMLQECAELARRGLGTAYFAVDAANTGALHLFRSLGFRSVRGAVLFFEKPLGAP